MEITNYKKFVSTITPKDLPRVGFDTHAHLSRHYFGDDIGNVLARAKENRLQTILSICLTLEAYHDAVFLYDSQDIDIYTAVGIHPCDILNETDAYKKELENILQNDSRIKAIGETGLDYHWDTVPVERQKEAFKEHIALAKKYNKALVLHTRKAEEDTYRILCDEGMEGYPVVWHCYGGTAQLAERIINHGWYISFAGNITYPNAQELREALHAIPLSQLLIETDSPYLSPQVQRGNKNEPAHLIYTVEVIAHELQQPVGELWARTSQNAMNLFAL